MSDIARSLPVAVLRTSPGSSMVSQTASGDFFRLESKGSGGLEKSGGLCGGGGEEGGTETIEGTTAAAEPQSPARPHPKLPPVPDLGNRRFCRACGKTLPVEAFPAGKRRYLCRRHLYLRVKRPSKLRALADPRRRLLWALWKRCWGDARRVFGQAGVGVTQGEIAATLAGLDMSECAVPSGGVEDPNIANIANIAILPEDPTQPVSRANVVVVDRGARRGLLAAFRGGGAARYGEELGGLE